MIAIIPLLIETEFILISLSLIGYSTYFYDYTIFILLSRHCMDAHF
jgi:hypothetical protein